MKPEALVNKLAELRSALATLKAQEDAVKEQILATGLHEIDSDLFRVTVTRQNGRTSTDWSAVKEDLWDSFEFRKAVQRHSREGEGSTVIRLTTRKQVAA